MKKALLSVSVLLSLVVSAQTGKTDQDLVQYINPLMGTESKFELSNGNTYPAIGMPWGMNMWTPQTGKNGDGWQYTYTADKIRGFKQTHQPSPWMNDYGMFSLMPITGSSGFDEDSRASWFSHKTEIATPYYYSVYLADHDITTEITPTERAAMFRFTFPKSDSDFVVIDAFDKGSYVKILPEERKIIGYSTKYSRGPLKNFKNYFVIKFDRAFTAADTWKDEELEKAVLEAKGEHVGALIGFKTTKKGEQITASVASSFISPQQAELNLKELGNADFNTVKEKGKVVWNKTLSKITVSGGTVDQMRTFYSCLYRMLFFPNKLYEMNAQGKPVHYSPYNGEVEDGYMFAGTGFWDTFRALYPFLNLMYPQVAKQMQEGLINDYKEGGWLPEWSSPGYADIMIGNNSASVVADAYVKGLRGYDIEILYKALIKDANHEGPISAVGRKGVDYYNKLGYIPSDVDISQSAARTLEYAYDDYCIYKLGKLLGKPDSEISVYKERAMNYKQLFDPKHKLMRGKLQDGAFAPDFNPHQWGGVFTEGNSWHYSWSVFQDVSGLSKMMGGDASFIHMLDSVFIMPSYLGIKGSKHVIHEMREMQVAGMGQYAHGNQPIQHMIYLYDYTSEPWKTQYWSREVMNRLYKATPDGYCGDEDNGQTSAWYVFSALGFYPVTPASTQYAVGAPLFKKAELHFDNGKILEIRADNNSADNRYIQNVRLDGKSYSKNYYDHFDLLKGGTINIKMGDTPNKERGAGAKDRPFSMSDK